MNDQSSSSRKIIVAIAMAVVVAIGTVTFALRSHRPTAVAQIPPVPASVPQAPDAANSIAQTPNVPSVVPQIPDVPVSAAQRDRNAYTASDTAVPAAVEPRSAADRSVVNAHTRVGTSNRSDTRTDSAVVSSKKPAVATVAGGMDAGTRLHTSCACPRHPPHRLPPERAACRRQVTPITCAARSSN